MEERLETGIDTIATSSVRPQGGHCCLHHAALDALTIPVIVHDQDFVLYANAEAAHSLSISEPSELSSRSIESILHPDSAESARDRRRLIMERGASFQGVHLKARREDGTILYVVSDDSPIRWGESGQAVVQMARYIDGDSFVTYTSPITHLACEGDPADHECLHRAAFEALPVPVVIQNQERIIDGNMHSRHVLSNGDSLRDVALSDVLHPDFVQAGSERRNVLLEQRHAYRGLSAKLLSRDGKTVYIIVDGAPLEFDGEPLAVLVARDVRVH